MIEKYSSPNFNERVDAQNPSIILHYTGMQSGKDALERLCDPQSEVSAHYLIDENGDVYNLVPEDKRAWHAGVSYWAGETDINSASIGIELANPGHEFGYREFPDAQIDALINLSKDIMKRYDIPTWNVLGHSDVAPGRKVDPGHLFPWKQLAENGVGLWPFPNENDMDEDAAKDLLNNPDTIHELFVHFGYNPQKSLGNIVLEFHRHYAPEKFLAWNDIPKIPDITTISFLLALLRAKKANNN